MTDLRCGGAAKTAGVMEGIDSTKAIVQNAVVAYLGKSSESLDDCGWAIQKTTNALVTVSKDNET